MMSSVIALAVALSSLNPTGALFEEPLGEIGSGVVFDQPATIPDGYVAAESRCLGTFQEVKDRLPKDFGTAWFWADLTSQRAAGLHFTGRNTVILSTTLPCEYVPVVTLHEWTHELQERTGLHDATPVNGTPRYEIVAECTARTMADHYGWPHYDSYPEMTGVPCSELTSDVQALLAQA